MELIQLQKKALGLLKKGFDESFRDWSPQLKKYRSEYDRRVSEYRKAIDKDDLIRRVLESDIVYNGNFLVVRTSASTPVRVLREVVGNREIILALGFISPNCQRHLDSFLARRTNFDGFASLVSSESGYKIPWRNYEMLLDFAQKGRIRTIGIDYEVDRQSDFDWIHKRAQLASNSISKAAQLHPKSLIYVFDQNLYVIPSLEPKIVSETTNRRIKSMVIYQNSPDIHFQLAQKGLESKVDIVQISEEEFCIFNIHPLYLYKSQQNWENKVAELAPKPVVAWNDQEKNSPSVEGQVKEVAKRIASRLGLSRKNIQSLRIYSCNDLELLKILDEDSDIPEPVITQAKRNILRCESFFLTEVKVIYIADLSLVHVAEEVSHYLNYESMGKGKTLSQGEDFYQRIFAEALGYFGSKLIVPNRGCELENDYLAKLSSSKNISSLLTDDPDFYRLSDLESYIHLTHALGYTLGEKLYCAVEGKQMTMSDVRKLFHTKFDDFRFGYKTYMEIKTLT